MIGGGEDPPVGTKVHANRDRLAEQPVAAQIETVPGRIQRTVVDGAAEACLEEIAIEERKIPSQANIGLIYGIIAGGDIATNVHARTKDRVSEVVLIGRREIAEVELAAHDHPGIVVGLHREHRPDPHFVKDAEKPTPRGAGKFLREGERRQDNAERYSERYTNETQSCPSADLTPPGAILSNCNRPVMGHSGDL